MQQINNILKKIEDGIQNTTERSYFWTHEVRYRYILSKIQEIARGRSLTILDIGCFPYHVGKALEEQGHQVWGIASEHEPVKNKQIALLNIERDPFPFDAQFFDLVLCNEVLEHLPQSPVFALSQIKKILKENGLLMVTTPNSARSINRGKLLVGKSIFYPIDVYFENKGKGNNIYHRHNREYTLSELISLLKKSDWEIQTSGYFISYTADRKRMQKDPVWLHSGKKLNVWLMQLFPSLQDTLIVIAAKK